MKKQIDLGDFTFNNSFYSELNLIVSIKSFDLQAIRERYIKTKNKKSNRAGSFTRREIAEGGLAQFIIKNGKLQNQEVLLKVPEPRGIDFKNNVLAFSSENKVFILEKDKINELNYPWFSFIHTVDLKEGKILISSSGFDAIFEFNYQNGEKIFEWLAWENGFNQGVDPITGNNTYLTRKKGEAELYKSKNLPFIYIENPENQTVPTAQRSAFINSVVYDNQANDKIIATFFHEGSVYIIDKRTNSYEKVITGLRNPHGGKRWRNEFIATSTTEGAVILGSLNDQKKFNFQKLKGKPSLLKGLEWVQNSIIKGDLVISIDSNRNSFIIFDINKKLIDIVPFDQNFAIQDIVFGQLYENQKKLLKEI